MDGRDALSCHSNGYNIISCLSEKRPHVILYYLILSLLFETTRRTFFLDLYPQPGSCRASTLIRLTVKFNCWSQRRVWRSSLAWHCEQANTLHKKHNKASHGDMQDSTTPPPVHTTKTKEHTNMIRRSFYCSVLDASTR